MIASLIAASYLTVLPAPAQPTEVVEAMFNVFNRHDAAGMVALYADDARLTSSDFCTPRGKQDVQRTYQVLFDTFPDIRDDVDTMVASGDRVAVRFTARSSAGPQPLSMRIMTMLTVKDGLIVEDDSVFDTGGQPCQP